MVACFNIAFPTKVRSVDVQIPLLKMILLGSECLSSIFAVDILSCYASGIYTVRFRNGHQDIVLDRSGKHAEQRVVYVVSYRRRSLNRRISWSFEDNIPIRLR